MVFSGELCDKVLDGTKTQTRRPARLTGDGWDPCRYRVGQTYAIQRKRGTHGLGPRILVLSVRGEYAFKISEVDARAEGFANAAAFVERWHALYGALAPLHCWRIEFELVP